MTNPFRPKSVQATADFARIRALPTRTPLDIEQLAREMTDALKRTDGCPGKTSTKGLCDTCGQPTELRGVQALALFDCMANNGLFAPLGCGTGKTLVFLLASVVLDLKRAIGLVPASLIEKTERERRLLLKHWRVDKGLQLFSYERLGLESSAKWLDLKAPDGIVTDETHRLKNPDAACTRRVDRWMQQKPQTKFVAMSGTFTKNSLRDFAHIVQWCLGDEHAPIPQKYGEIEEWADALDERVQPLKRLKPGALLKLATSADIVEDDELATARRAFQRRLSETPGIVCSLNAEQVDCSLSISKHVTKIGSVTEENFRKLRGDPRDPMNYPGWETPDGWELCEAVDVWRHARELAIGFHYIWDPRPPEEWLAARRAWAKCVRGVLARSRTLDSEKQVRNAAIGGELGDGPRKLWTAWEEILPTFQVNQLAVWHDDAALKKCESWMSDNVGIVWTEHTFFGRELERRTGFPYFGQNGLDARGKSILDAKGPIIASIAANGTGKNLQRYRRNLITACPTGAHVWEQLLARTHRPGQLADEVTAEVLIGCIEHVEAWERAIAEAEMSRDMLGQPQKILFADVNMPAVDDMAFESSFRWKKNRLSAEESY